jgi:hypothetical protein
MKGPAQIAFEASCTALTWAQLDQTGRDIWAAIAEAVRLAALEEAAKAARERFRDGDTRDICTGLEISNSILALGGGKKDG